MNWQLLLAALIVAAAACYLARQAWRSWAGKKSGCGGCGCGKAPAAAAGQRTIIPVEQLTLRRPGSRAGWPGNESGKQ
jgi:hypothetical protein